MINISRSFATALIGASTVLTVAIAPQTRTAAVELLGQIHPTAAQKVVTFGLVAEPQPYIPTGLEQSRNPNPNSRGIIGLDDRIPMTSTLYPWSAIGRLESPIDDTYYGICTGSLVAADIVLTNAHCVVDPVTHQVKQNITFKPNLINGFVADEADIANVVDILYGTDFSDLDTIPHPNDWAFVKLDRPLGNTYGTLAWTPLSVSELVHTHGEALILVGYSGDFPAYNPGNTAGVHDGCSVLGEVEGSLIHNCDTTGGSSGGPMLALIDGEFRIVALNSAELTEEYEFLETGDRVRYGIVNYGVKIDPIINFIRQAAR
jgi:V8-like Glu-specific endopeptidase